MEGSVVHERFTCEPARVRGATRLSKRPHSLDPPSGGSGGWSSSRRWPPTGPQCRLSANRPRARHRLERAPGGPDLFLVARGSIFMPCIQELPKYSARGRSRLEPKSREAKARVRSSVLGGMDHEEEEPMSEHHIRLRGGWEILDLDQLDQGPRRINLPMRFAPGKPRRVRLVRRFGPPAHDSAREIVSLRIENVPGLVRAALNGQDQRLSPDHRLELVDVALNPRNELVLDVAATDAEDAWDDWGRVALVIGPRPHLDQPPLA